MKKTITELLEEYGEDICRATFYKRLHVSGIKPERKGVVIYLTPEEFKQVLLTPLPFCKEVKDARIISISKRCD